MIHPPAESLCESITWEGRHYPKHGHTPSLWRAKRNGVAVAGVGAAGLLQGPLTAFFASRQCPGTARPGNHRLGPAKGA